VETLEDSVVATLSDFGVEARGQVQCCQLFRGGVGVISVDFVRIPLFLKKSANIFRKCTQYWLYNKK
jgi:hypothetical protein